MNKIEENIRLLAVFHYVFAALVAVVSLIPVIHIALGVVMLAAPQAMCGENCKELPPEFLGWIFLGVGAFAMIFGLSFAAMVVLAGRYLSRRIHHTFCIAVAAVSCLFMPFGTVLGIFTLVTIMKPEAEALFS